MNQIEEKHYKTLVQAIHERYNEMLDDGSFAPSSPESLSCDTPSSSMPSSFDNKKDENSLCSFYIPAHSPRKTQSGIVITSCSLIMSNQNINEIGDFEALKRSCKNVVELDLAKNQIHSFDEVKKLLNALKNLHLLNLSHNLLSMNNLDLNQCKRYFSEWPDIKQLKILILNSSYVKLNELQYFLNKLTNLNELHLCGNNYDRVNFDEDFSKESLKILYLNNNRLNNWLEVCKLGKAFPNLETLVISDNPLLTNFDDSHEHHHNHHHHHHHHYHNRHHHESKIDDKKKLNTSDSFSNLQQLIMNKLSVNEWSNIDQLRKFPQLKHVRVQNIPLLESYTDEEKYYLLVGHLEGPTTLNGSEISEKEKDRCERKLIRYFMDKLNKPNRYYELESKHGKLDKLADVNLVANNRAYVKIKFEEKTIFETIDVRSTVSEFKKLEKFVGHTSNKFRIYYIDVEAMNMYGPEELKHANRCLHSFNIRDGDEFEIDLKQQITYDTSIYPTKSTTNKTKSATSKPNSTTASRQITKTTTTKTATINCTRKSQQVSNNNNNKRNSDKINNENEHEQECGDNETHQPMTPSPIPPSTPSDNTQQTTNA